MRRSFARVALWLLRCRVQPGDVMRRLGQVPLGRVIVVSNHVSLIDGIVLALASPVPMAFGVDSDFSVRNRWTAAGLRLLVAMGYGYVVPLDSRSALGARALLRYLQAGHPVMVFPAGEIGVGGVEREQPGVRWLAVKAGAEVVQAQIVGAERSRLFGRARDRQWWPAITVRF